MPKVAADACKMSNRWKKRPKLRRLNELCASVLLGPPQSDLREDEQATRQVGLALRVQGKG